MIAIRLLQSGDEGLFANCAEDVFDNSVDPALVSAFFADPRHHIVAAIDGAMLIGFVSAVDYIHPDKPAELCINETGVSPAYQRQGLARAMFEAMLKHGQLLGCIRAWVLTDSSNQAANALYKALGGVEGVDSDVSNRAMTGYSFDLTERIVL